MKKTRILSLLLTAAVIFSQAAIYSHAAPAPSASPSSSASPAASTSPSASPSAVSSPAPSAEPSKAVFPEPHAKAAVLIDLKGGRTIYQSHADEKAFPASTTKIMTALLALEKGNLSDVITVSETALADINYLHSRIDLKVGEELTLEQLLTALLVSSANDAANAVAEYISGDIPSFVALMNQRAKELGMTHTNFVNPHGFHDENHYTTANDLAVVTREAIKNAKFCELVKIKTAKLAATNISKARTISSTNHLISRYRNTFHYYPYATGVKTGSTDEAGSCLVATAEKNGISLLSVVLGCENENQNEGAYSFVDTKEMFEYIFNNYKSVTIASTGEILSDSKVYEAKDNTRVALSPSKDIIMLLPGDYTAEELGKQTSLPENVAAPIEKGSQLGTVTFTFRGETIATADLLAANEVKRDNFLHFIHGVTRVLFSPYVLIPVLAIAVILLWNAYVQSQKRKARRRKMKSHRPQQNSSYRGGYYNGARPRSGRRNPSSPNQGRTHPGRHDYTGNPQNGSTRRSSRPSNTRSSNTNRNKPDPWDKYR